MQVIYVERKVEARSRSRNNCSGNAISVYYLSVRVHLHFLDIFLKKD
jgi:hypothetical protein